MKIAFCIPLWYSRGGYYDASRDELCNGWRGLDVFMRIRRQKDFRVHSFIISADFGIAWGCLNIGRNR